MAPADTAGLVPIAPIPAVPRKTPAGDQDLERGQVVAPGLMQLVQRRAPLFAQRLRRGVESGAEFSVLASAGIQLFYDNVHPMVDIVNYAPRITVPVLMINGRFDHSFPTKAASAGCSNCSAHQRGTKSTSLRQPAHQLSAQSAARDVSNWFDQYVGKVRAEPTESALSPTASTSTIGH